MPGTDTPIYECMGWQVSNVILILNLLFGKPVDFIGSHSVMLLVRLSVPSKQALLGMLLSWSASE